MHAVQQQQDNVVKAGAQIHSTPVLKKRGAPAAKRGAPVATTTVVVDDKHQICKPPPQELTDISQSLKADGVGDSTPTTVSTLTMLSTSTFWDHEGTVTVNDQKWLLVHDSSQLEILVNGRQGCTLTYWRMEDQYNGSIYAPGCDKRDEKLTPYDFFSCVLPQTAVGRDGGKHKCKDLL